MAELLKHHYNEHYILQLIRCFTRVVEDFDGQGFHQRVFDSQWSERELKQRMDHIARSIHLTLNMDVAQSLDVLSQVCVDFGGFEGMFFPHYVEIYTQDNPELRPLALSTLKHMTRFSSSEFAIRPFIKQDPQSTMDLLLEWSHDDNEHVRRLASEGCRPRLPWAMALPEFKQDPQLILPILEQLRTDPSEYVRRSVANNLNDIAKDNPDIVRQVASEWLGSNPLTDWIVKHGCRTLLKQADPHIMTLFGYHPVESLEVRHFECQASANIGEHIAFQGEIVHPQQPLGKLRIEYAIDYRKANGSLSRKVFKLSEGEYTQSMKGFQRRQSVQNMSTRKHYPGLHKLHILVNGVILASADFNLQ